jgi:hypothetical protein
MTQVSTVMRAAFEKAIATQKFPTNARNGGIVRDALRRKCGLVTRKTMWSIQRGNR